MAHPYSIVFSGRLAPGADPQAVKARLARALGRDTAYVERLFDRGRHVLKRVTDRAEANHYLALLARAGIQADLEAEERPSAPPATAAAVEPIGGRLLFLAGLPVVTAGALLLLATGPLLALISLAVAGATLAALHALALPPALLAAVDLLLFGAGLFGALFFLKPFVSAAPVTALALEREIEPDLFALAAAASEAVGAPPPGRITLVAAAAVTVRSQRHGSPGLYVGLPLLRAATVAELAGLIAHAASPWATGRGGRLARLLAWCDRQLERAAEIPDALDCRLDRWRTARLTGWARRLADAGKAAPRALLGAERRLAGRFLARLTADADAAQVALAGAEAFDQAWHRVRLLTFVGSRLLDGAPKWQAAGRFPADLAARAVTTARELSPAAVQSLLTATDHALRAAGRPDDATRRRHRPAGEGTVPFTCTRPAHELVRRLPVYGRRQALRIYRNQLGMAVTGNRMRTAASADRAAVDAYFGQVFDPFVPIRPQFREDWDTPHEVTAEWAEVVGGLGRLATRGQAALAQLTAADGALIDGMQRLLLLRAGRPLHDGGETAEELLHAACRREEGNIDVALGTLVPYTARVTRRLCAALTLLAFPDSQGRVDGAAMMLAEGRHLTAFLDRTAVALPALRRLRWHLLALEVLLTEPCRPSGRMADRIDELSADLRQELAAVTAALRGALHPLLTRPAPFLQWAGAGVPEGESAERLLDRGEALLDRLLRTQEAATARLVTMASRVEAGWGLSA